MCRGREFSLQLRSHLAKLHSSLRDLRNPALKSIYDLWIQREMEVIDKLEEYRNVGDQNDRMCPVTNFFEPGEISYISGREYESLKKIMARADAKEKAKEEAKIIKPQDEDKMIEAVHQYVASSQNPGADLDKILNPEGDDSIELIEPKDLKMPGDFDIGHVPDFRKSCHFYHQAVTESTFFSNNTNNRTSFFSGMSLFSPPSENSSIMTGVPYTPSVEQLEQQLYNPGNKIPDDDEDPEVLVSKAVESGTLSKVVVPPPRTLPLSLGLMNSIHQNPQPDITAYTFNFKEDGMMHRINGISVKATDSLILHTNTGALFTYDPRTVCDSAKFLKYLDHQKDAQNKATYSLKVPDSPAIEDRLVPELPETAPFPTGTIDFVHIDAERDFTVVVKDDIWHRFRNKKADTKELVLMDKKFPPLSKFPADRS